MLAANKNGNVADINAISILIQIHTYTHGMCACVSRASEWMMVHFDLQNIIYIYIFSSAISVAVNCLVTGYSVTQSQIQQW